MKIGWTGCALLFSATVAFADTPLGKDLSGAAWLARVPPVPDSALAAFAQWEEVNGTYQPTGDLKSFEADMMAALRDLSSGALPGAGPAAAPQAPQAPSPETLERIKKFSAEFSTPEGKARLRKMTPEQYRAMSEAMTGPRPSGGSPSVGVSPHDSAALKRISQLQGADSPALQGLQRLLQESAGLEGAFREEASALGSKEMAALRALPTCHNEAGEPSSAAVREVKLKFADAQIQLATRHLGKFAALAVKARAFATEDVNVAEDALAAYNTLENPALKTQLRGQAQLAHGRFLNDAADVFRIVKSASELGMKTVAEKKHVEKMYAGAKGC